MAARLRENIAAWLAADPTDNAGFMDAMDRIMAIQTDLEELQTVLTAD
jgi:hypothetical protein